jgi:hypothetical protein
MMSANSIISFDGSWSHRRRAKECVVLIIDCSLKKVVDFRILQKSKFGRPGNYSGSSNGMEVAALRKLIVRWNGNPNIAGFVHDSDSRASKAIRDAGWHIAEWFDPNHVAKSFDTIWRSLSHGHLREFQTKLKLWFNYLTHSDDTPDEKVLHWRNSLNHFLGDHRNCSGHHPNLKLKTTLVGNPVGQSEVAAIFEKGSEMLRQTRGDLSSQLCESRNAIKVRFAEKLFSWKTSWSTRVRCAIMHMNRPEAWKFDLFASCHLPRLHPRVEAILHQTMQERIDMNQRRRSQEYQSRERVRRFKARMADGRDAAGSQDYGHSDNHSQTQAPAKQPEPLEMDQTGPLPPTEVDDRVTQWVMPTAQESQQASAPDPAESMSPLIPWEEADPEEEGLDDPDEDGSEFSATTPRKIPTAKRHSYKHPTIPGSEHTGTPANLYDLPPPHGRYECQTKRGPDVPRDREQGTQPRVVALADSGRVTLQLSSSAGGMCASPALLHDLWPPTGGDEGWSKTGRSGAVGCSEEDSDDDGDGDRKLDEPPLIVVTPENFDAMIGADNVHVLEPRTQPVPRAEEAE